MPEKSKKTKPAGRLPQATLKNPTIEAILGGHFRFATQEQAEARLQAVRESFMVSRTAETEGTPNPHELKLWIRGYGMTAEAREAGYLGNFALIRVARGTEEKWTLTATLLNIDKKYHPQRRQLAQKFPNWGNPILRDIQKGRTHKTLTAVQGELVRLHEAFPEVTIPLTNKLYIMVYGKAKANGRSPVEKWVLEIKATEGNDEFVIAYAPNTYRAANPVEAGQAGEPVKKAATKAEAQGKFSAQVLLSQRKRKPRAPRKPVSGSDE